MKEDTLLSEAIMADRTGSELYCVCCSRKCKTDDSLDSALQENDASKRSRAASISFVVGVYRCFMMKDVHHNHKDDHELWANLRVLWSSNRETWRELIMTLLAEKMSLKEFRFSNLCEMPLTSGVMQAFKRQITTQLVVRIQGPQTSCNLTTGQIEG